MAKPKFFIDPLTGLRVRSGRVYEASTSVAKALSSGSVDSVNVERVKYRLSKDSLVIDSMIEPPPSIGGNGYQRIVYQGNFTKDKAGALYGPVTGYSKADYGLYWHSSDPAKRNQYVEQIYIDKPAYAVNLRKSKGVEAVSSSLNDGRYLHIYKSYASGNSYYEGFDSPSQLVASDKGQFQALGVDSYFSGSWWSNLF